MLLIFQKVSEQIPLVLHTPIREISKAIKWKGCERVISFFLCTEPNSMRSQYVTGFPKRYLGMSN